VRQFSSFAVNLDHLEFNLQELKRLVKGSEILFMVKADGYGHGAMNIAAHAYRQGIKNFGLATVHEAIALRRHLRDESELYVFSDLQLHDTQISEAYQNLRLFPVLSTLPELELFLSLPQMKKVPVVLKINIGMNRLGLFAHEWEQALKILKTAGRKSIFHLMGHLSNSSNNIKTDPLNIKQISVFGQAKKYFRESGLEVERTSLSNSGAIEQSCGLDESFVRPGLMLYGPSALNPSVVRSWKGKMIGTLKAQILHMFPVKKDMTIGYGGNLIPQDGHVVLLSLGYGDGLPTRLMGIKSSISKIPGEFVGRINMDMAQFLISSKDEKKFKIGDVVDLWDDDAQNFLNICQQANVLSYEFFCQLTSRVPRVYTTERQLRAGQ
jgi:alanine racemase